MEDRIKELERLVDRLLADTTALNLVVSTYLGVNENMPDSQGFKRVIEALKSNVAKNSGYAPGTEEALDRMLNIIDVSVDTVNDAIQKRSQEPSRNSD